MKVALLERSILVLEDVPQAELEPGQLFSPAEVGREAAEVHLVGDRLVHRRPAGIGPAVLGPRQLGSIGCRPMHDDDVDQLLDDDVNGGIDVCR